MDLQGVEKAKNELRSELGEGKVLDDDFVLSSYTREGSTSYHLLQRPLLVTLPHTTEEVQKIVREANKRKIPVVPSGLRTSHGGALDCKGAIVIDTCNMNRILQIDGENLTFTVQAGANVDAVNRELRKSGFIYAVHPEHDAPKPFGSEVAKATAGTVGAMLGNVSKRLVGLQVVLGNGDILETGSSRVIKTTPNFLQTGIPDLTQLFVASEGAYGVITEVTMEMSQIPVARGYIDVRFGETMDDLKRCLGAFQEIRTKRLGFTGYVFDIYILWMALRSIVDREAFGPGLRDAVRAMVPSLNEKSLWEQFGYTGLLSVESLISQEECDLKKKEAIGIFRKHGGEILPTDGMFMSLLDDLERGGLNYTVVEFADGRPWTYTTGEVPLDRVPEYWEKWYEVVDEFNWPRKYTWCGGTVGSNSFWIFAYSFPDPHDEKMIQDWRKLMEKTAEVWAEIGFVPYRMSRKYRPYILDKLDPSYLKYIMGIKKLFDPNNIMNPGVAVFEEGY
jgi:FAD/FMN-containing dehydrogenase